MRVKSRIFKIGKTNAHYLFIPIAIIRYMGLKENQKVILNADKNNNKIEIIPL